MVLAGALGGADAGAAKKQRRADLSVRSAGAGVQAGRVTVTLVASNGGRRKAPASAAMVTWKPVGSPVVTVLKRFSVPALKARGRRSVKVAMAIPSGASGAYVVSVCLNVREAVRETSRSNNCRSAGRVSVPAAGALGEVRTSAPSVPSLAAPAPAAPVPPGTGTPGTGGDPGADTTPPDTTIGRGPVGTTNTRSETFMFAASEAGATFQCRLDAGAWEACSTPKGLTLLADGPHTFEVRARDAAGNIDPSPASRSWTVDAGPPETEITAGPAPQVNTTSASLEFAASDANASFQCRLDSAVAWTFCDTPYDLTGLAVGAHTLRVRAIDTAGNIDPTPATRTWTVDLTPPQTTLGSGPAAGATTGPSVAFGFTSEAGASFQCRLDGGDWAACSSPASYANLPDGAHAFEVRAIDAAGNPDPSPAQRSWTVDATAPDTTIDTGPSGLLAGRDASFTFSAPGAATFECRLDGGSWSACSSPKGYAALGDGSHTFEVRAVDALGNADATPAQRTWSIDATAPLTTLDTGPSGAVASTSASFTFSAEAGATFECRLDAGAWAACTSPQAYADLADGSHTFDVRAIDGLGNTDATPAQRTWTVDTTAPQTTIDDGPSGTLATASASLTFSSESGATFECRMNGGTWLPCPSPKAYAKLADGFHTFEVRAVDAAGNTDASPAQRTWTVDTTAPETAIDIGPSGTVESPDATFTFSSPDAGATFTCRLDGGVWAPCTSPVTFTGLADGPHTLEVTAADAAGNADATPATRTWTVATVPAP